MKAFRTLLTGAAILIVVLLVLFFNKNIFSFFSNLRMAFVGSAENDLSYRSLLNFKLSHEASSSVSAPDSSNSAAKTIDGFKYVYAEVFSDYPLNNYSSVTINAGSKDGLSVGMPVLAGNNILLGKITAVGQNKSEVETFFDPAWKSPVFIGDGKVRGLLTGGSSPYIDFIPKNSTTTAGMTIMNADSGYPMNLVIGYVDSLEGTNNDLWLRAKVKPVFDLSYLNGVFVLTNF
ncbi:rod shape-determining protein MreC [Patescibacteria group bacterium]|nr:rod shape-determining protein MreC [Patescibacteria group bacterium]